MGGILSMEDLNNYQVAWEETDFVDLSNGMRMHVPTLPSSGVVTAFVVKMMDMLVNKDKVQAKSKRLPIVHRSHEVRVCPENKHGRQVHERNPERHSAGSRKLVVGRVERGGDEEAVFVQDVSDAFALRCASQIIDGRSRNHTHLGSGSKRRCRQ